MKSTGWRSYGRFQLPRRGSVATTTLREVGVAAETIKTISGIRQAEAKVEMLKAER
jgi:hypothetical protein